MSATRMPPAKMLPKSRSANEIGLAISSTMLIGAMKRDVTLEQLLQRGPKGPRRQTPAAW